MTQCSESVCGEGQWGAFNQHRCSKQAVVTRNGKPYCKIHDPKYIEQKDTEREARRAIKRCPKCSSYPEIWWAYCPRCGTKYPRG